MNAAQRGVLALGLVSLLHSALVPPVQQVGEEAVCRYHEFIERSWPFTRGYGVTGGDPVALLSEVGLIVAVFGAAWLLLGARGRPT